MDKPDRPVMNRRRFLACTAAGAALTLTGGLGLAAKALAANGPKITLPPLPWAENALEPYISARTISFHYGKHHAGYVKKINKFIKGTPYESMGLVEIIRASAGKPDQANVFNNAAQVWNHTFYWNSMKPGGGGRPDGQLAGRIKEDFGGLDQFKQALVSTAGSQFGSGWGWLVLENGKLKVIKTMNADTPIAHGLKPLLTVDVWEHAYYLDYQNRRGDYLKAWVDHLANWDFANRNLAM